MDHLEAVRVEDIKIFHKGGQVAYYTCALVGKSTIAALLERFYDVDRGSVFIDGKDIRDLDPSWLRGRALGFINQVRRGLQYHS